MEADEKSVTTSWGESLQIENITKIDKRKWEKKGIASVHFKNEFGLDKFMVFDDFKYDRDSMGEIMKLAEKNLKPDQIVGGATATKAATELNADLTE